MRKVCLFLMVAALVILVTWVIPPAGQAQRSQEADLVNCCVKNTGKCEKQTKKACQNAGGKEVASCDKCEKGK